MSAGYTQALDWLCANKLIVPGTIIGYDDYKWGLDLRKGEKKKVLDGEARAHDEILLNKYGLKMSKLGKVIRADSFAVVVTAVPWAASISEPQINSSSALAP